MLTNAAAVDLILRAYLSRHLHPDAVAEMTRGSCAESVKQLRELPHEDFGDSPADGLSGPARTPKIILKATPRDAPKGVAGRIIQVEVRKDQQWLPSVSEGLA